MKPKLEDLSAALIAVFEGPERLEAYQDTGGVWTIGRGHTRGVKAGDTCTHQQAVAWFAEDRAPLIAMVASKPLFAGAAYASFGYNCGTAALHAVLSGSDTITNPRHTTDRHGVVQPGLVSRRTFENMMILACEPAPSAETPLK